MTGLCVASSIKASKLSLKILHFLTSHPEERHVMEANDSIKMIKICDLKQVRVLPPSSRLVIVIEGIVDGSAVSAEQICNSAVGKHLLECLRKNSDTLCIHDISAIAIENGNATISFSSSHPRLDGVNSPHLIFLSLKLVYTWRSGLAEKDGLNWETSVGCNIPFNPITSSRVSPFVELLDKIGHRLFCHHIIRRYPWIFGPYSKTVRRERAFFPVIAKSLCSVFGRSEDKLLRSKFLAKIKEMRRKNTLHDQLANQSIYQAVQKRDSVPADRADMSTDDLEFIEETASSSLVLEEFLTNMFVKGAKPWIKGLRGYSGGSEEEDSHISDIDLIEIDSEDMCYQDETPELDWSSSESDSIQDEFELIQNSDVCDEDFSVEFPEFPFSDAHSDFKLGMSSDRVEARSVGNATSEDDGCLESMAGIEILPQRSFDADPMTREAKSRSPLRKLFLNRVTTDDVAREEPNWSEMDVDDDSDGIFDFEFSLEPSYNVHGPLLSGGITGQEWAVHVNDLFDYGSGSEMD